MEDDDDDEEEEGEDDDDEELSDTELDDLRGTMRVSQAIRIRAAMQRFTQLAAQTMMAGATWEKPSAVGICALFLEEFAATGQAAVQRKEASGGYSIWQSVRPDALREVLDDFKVIHSDASAPSAEPLTSSAKKSAKRNKLAAAGKPKSTLTSSTSSSSTSAASAATTANASSPTPSSTVALATRPTRRSEPPIADKFIPLLLKLGRAIGFDEEWKLRAFARRASEDAQWRIWHPSEVQLLVLGLERFGDGDDASFVKMSEQLIPTRFPKAIKLQLRKVVKTGREEFRPLLDRLNTPMGQWPFHSDEEVILRRALD